MKRIPSLIAALSGTFILASAGLHAQETGFVNAIYSVGSRLQSDRDIVEQELGDFDFIYLVAPPQWKAEDFDLSQKQIEIKYVRDFSYPDEEFIRKYISTVHRTGGKVLCSFPGSEFIDIATSEKRSWKFARMMAAFVEKYDYDGIELDWEHTVTEELHLKFMQKIRTELDRLGRNGRQYWLTTALHHYRNYTREQAEQLCACVDWINIMFYDMGGGIWGTVASHNAPLDLMKAAVLRDWKYFPHGKLHIGLPNYGFYYKGILPGEQVPDGKKLDSYGRYCNYTELPPLLEKGWYGQWDAAAQSTYFFSPDKTEFMTLETPRSMDAKLDWIAENGFGGVFWWEYSCDWIRPEKQGERGRHLITDYVTQRVNAWKEGWKLAWEDNFESEKIDWSVWSKTERGTADWADTQSKDERCYGFRDGNLILRGIVNDDRQADTAAYLTGGLVTQGKKPLSPGRIEVRARLHAARGAWPAIWLLPYDPQSRWPKGGEIDIMERLNNDSFVYQTVHSYYTYVLGKKDNPVNFGTIGFNPEEFNVFGVDILQDSVVFHVNGVRNFAYPRVKEIPDSLGQFPYHQPMYLLIDMQLGGSWVGETDPEDLPVEMEVDWVRHYIKKD